MHLQVARHEHRAAFVVEAIRIRRRNRRVVHFDRGDPQRAVIEDESRAVLGRRRCSGQFDRPGHHRPRRRGHDRIGVMRGPVALIEAIGVVEAGDDPLDAGAAIDRQRRRAAARPRLQVELAEVADVIGMEVREQHAANRRERHPPQHEVLDRFRADIDDVELAAGEDRDAGLRAIRAGQRRRRSADRHAQRVVRKDGVVGGRRQALRALDRRAPAPLPASTWPRVR